MKVSKIQSPPYIFSPLSASEIKNAEIFWTRCSQMLYFSQYYNNLSHNLPISNKSNIIKLNPVFHSQSKCIRIGGRLKHAELCYEEKHPLLLHSSSTFASLLISDRHRRVLHGGTQLTLATIRETHWIINGRRAVKSIISKCVPCIRYRGTVMTQQMGNLPASRIIPSSSFSHVGVDFAGPIKIRSSAGRGHKSVKGYICVFVCFCIKAVHIEAVTGYDTNHFMLAFKRFVSRRGLCSDIYSDRGTNFVGADSQLKQLFSQSSKEF